MKGYAVNVRVWLMALLCGLTGCASMQPWKAQDEELSMHRLQARQEEMQADFDRRLTSMEMSLLRQEKFLRDYFDVPGKVVVDGLPAGPEPGLKDDPDPAGLADLADEPAQDSTEGEPAAREEQPITPRPEAEATSAATPRPDPQAVSAVPGQAFYEQALQKYYRGEYDEAREDFTVFADRYPDSSLQANALYWLAETHYAQKEYAQSVLVFKELTRRHPASRKTPDALLKAGYAYAQLGDIPNARFHLQLVLDDHPRTAAARLARERLDLLPGS